MANFGFDVSDVEVSERGDYEVMPKGEYTLKATDAELKNTSRGDGQYLAVTFEVVKGQYSGRKVWQNFNIHNPSEKAEKIGREQVAGWARAAGKPNARDSDDLLERSFQCKLDIEKGTGGYSDRNKIASFLTAETRSSASQAQTSKFEEEPKREEPREEKSAKEKPAQASKNPWD